MPKLSEREVIIIKLTHALKEERIQQGLSLNEVATRAGLSHTMVMRVEKHERLPTIDTLLRITDAMGVDLASLLRRAVKETRGNLAS